MRKKTTAALMALFLGGLGIHRFYLGQPILGILYLLFSWTFIPLLISIIDSIIILTYSKEKFDKKYNNIKQNSSELVNNDTPKTIKSYNSEYSQEFPLNKEYINTSLKSNKYFLLNPNSNFKLHIFNAPEKILIEVQDILLNEKIWYKEKDLLELFAANNIKCKEIEDYISKYKTQYHKFIEKAKLESLEYQQASEMDKIEIEREFRVDAINNLDERAACDLILLFEGSEIPKEIDDELIKEYGFDTISKYISLYKYNDKNKIITHWERKEFEDLLNAGLAISGNDLPIEEILYSQTLKILNKIAEKEDNHFKRKKKAIDYLNENPHLLKNLGKYISTRSLFKIQPLPKKFEHINLTNISLLWDYHKEYISLLLDTYTSSERYTNSINENKPWVKAFKIEKHEDFSSNFICQRARRECNKKYTKNTPPSIPFHVGCNCDLIIEIK